jgi:hypothetical protein
MVRHCGRGGIVMVKYLFASAAALAIGLAIVPDALAQSKRPARPRIEIRPGPLYHRECVDGLRPVSNKYVGRTVLMPYMRCWWVRG